MVRLMFGWDFEVDAWSRFWRWNLIKICVWTCDMNSTLGSVVPLAMFWVQYASPLFYKYPIETFHDMAYIFLQYTIIKECLTKQIIQEARMKTSLLRQQTTSTSGKDFEPPLLFFRSALFDQFYIHSCSQYWHSFRNSEPLLKRIWKFIQISKP